MVPKGIENRRKDKSHIDMLQGTEPVIKEK